MKIYIIFIYIHSYVFEVVLFKYLFFLRFPTFGFKSEEVWRGRESSSLDAANLHTYEHILIHYICMFSYIYYRRISRQDHKAA